MGEIDTKPIESVQTALSFFGQKSDQLKNSSPTEDHDPQQVEKEREVERLEKEMAKIKLQLEAKDSAYKQALLKIDHHHKTAEELSTLLKNSDFQKQYYISECQDTKTRINELEKELAILREATMESLSQVEATKSGLRDENLKNDELLVRLLDMEEVKMRLETKLDESERGKAVKEAELEIAVKAISAMNKQLEVMQDLKNQLIEKSEHIDSLQNELNQANILRIASEKAASDTINELNQSKEDMQFQEKKISDQGDYISLLETELKQLRIGLQNANAESSHLSERIESMNAELEKLKEKENDAQVEIALQKFELHKARSKQAAAEAAEARAQSEKTALYNALQQMGLEAEDIKKQNRALQQESMKLHRPADDTENTSTNEREYADNHTDDKADEDRPMLENEGREVEDVRRELEMAVSKMGVLRTRAEQAISRAEAAEKAKAALEEKIRRSKQHKEKRKAAIAALQEELSSRDFGIDYNADDIIKYEDEVVADSSVSVRSYQPLGKVLNMKF